MVQKTNTFSGMPRRIKQLSIKVVSGGTESEVVDTEFYAIYGLIVPTIDNSTMTFKVSDDRTGSYSTVKDKDGTDVSISVGTGGMALSSDDLAAIAAYRYIKLILSGSQSVERVFKWLLKS